MPSLALLCETVDSLQCTAASIQAAIEAVRGNAAAAIHVAEAAAKDASAKLDPLTLASETRSALEAVRTVETRKIAALEAELVMLDEVLESILRTKEIGVWESLSPEAAVRLHELIVSPLEGPVEPPWLHFVPHYYPHEETLGHVTENHLSALGFDYIAAINLSRESISIAVCPAREAHAHGTLRPCLEIADPFCQ